MPLSCVEYVLARHTVPPPGNVLIIQHLLPDTEQFVRLISRVWRIVHIVGIPYSAKADVIRRLRKAFSITVPKKVEKMEDTVLHIISTLSSPTFIIDVGGYCASLATLPGMPIAGIVEETNQGHWRYKHVEKDLRYPVLSLAQCKVKQIEHLAVGTAIVFSFDKILRNELKDALQGKSVLVLGYGNVGRSVAYALRAAGAVVMVFDTDPARIIEAKFAGFRCGPKEELLQAAEVVFGCSGRQSIGQEDLDFLRSGVYLVSGSSRRIEFDVATFETLGLKERISESLTRIRLKNAEVILVNEGFPINFKDLSIPMAIADLIFAETLLALEVIGVRPPGLYADYTLNGEEAVLRHWIRSYMDFEL